MKLLGLYSLRDTKSGLISGLVTDFNESSSASFIIKNLKGIYNDLPDNEKNDFISSIRDYEIIKIGDLDLISLDLKNDIKTLVSLHDLDFMEVKNDI